MPNARERLNFGLSQSIDDVNSKMDDLAKKVDHPDRDPDLLLAAALNAAVHLQNSAMIIRDQVAGFDASRLPITPSEEKTDTAADRVRAHHKSLGQIGGRISPLRAADVVLLLQQHENMHRALGDILEAENLDVAKARAVVGLPESFE